MSFEIMHFRGAETILISKDMDKDVQSTMEYLNDALYGSVYRGGLTRQALEEMDWRHRENLNILEGRRYYYKGFKRGVAIDGNLSSYECIQDALLRLQVGYAQGKIDMGIVIINGHRSEKSPYGSTQELVKQEVEHLYPTISLPVTVVLFDLGKSDYGEQDDTINADYITNKKPVEPKLPA